MKKILFVISLFIFSGCVGSLREFQRIHDYPEEVNYLHKIINHDNSKKTITIVADHITTEIFDLIAPFYLFSSTQEANV